MKKKFITEGKTLGEKSKYSQRVYAERVGEIFGLSKKNHKKTPFSIRW